MKKILLLLAFLFSLNSINAKINSIGSWSIDSTVNVGLWTAVTAAIPSYIAHWCCGGIKDTHSKVIVGASGFTGGLVGLIISYYHTPEVRFNRSLDILQDELNEQWFTVFEEANTASDIWGSVDRIFFETRYPRVTGMMRIGNLYNSLIDCVNRLEKAVATESGRFIPNEYLIKQGKQMIERAGNLARLMQRWIIELRNDQTYMMQNNAHASEMAAAAARQAALNSSIAAMNSGNHYHYHRY